MLATGDRVQAQSLEEEGTPTRTLQGLLEILEVPAWDHYPAFTAYFVNGQEADENTITALDDATVAASAEPLLSLEYTPDLDLILPTDTESSVTTARAEPGATKGPYDRYTSVFEAAEKLSGNHPYGSMGTHSYYSDVQRQAIRIAQKLPTQFIEDRDFLREAALLMSAIPQSPLSRGALYRGTQEFEVTSKRDGIQPGDHFDMPLAPVTPNRSTADEFAKNLIIKITNPIPWIKTEGRAKLEEGFVSGAFRVDSITQEGGTKIVSVSLVRDYIEEAHAVLFENGWDYGEDVSFTLTASALVLPKLYDYTQIYKGFDQIYKGFDQMYKGYDQPDIFAPMKKFHSYLNGYTALANTCHSPEDGRFCSDPTHGHKNPADIHEAVYMAGERFGGDLSGGTRHYEDMQEAARRIADGKDVGNKLNTRSGKELADKDAALLMATLPATSKSEDTLYRGTTRDEGSPYDPEARGPRELSPGDEISLPLTAVTLDEQVAKDRVYNRGAIYEFPPASTPFIPIQGIVGGLQEGITGGKFRVKSVDYESNLDGVSETQRVVLEHIADHGPEARKQMKNNDWDFGPDLSLQASAETEFHLEGQHDQETHGNRGGSGSGLRTLHSHPVNTKLGKAFHAAGFSLFLVGGSVRDAISGNPDFADLDYTTDARPEQIKEITNDLGDQWGVGEKFGTIGVQIDGLKTEITTFRTEVYDEESRKPTVDFGDTIEDDLRRRDLTINSMALTIASDGNHKPGDLVDPHNGATDLMDGVLRTPDDPTKSMSEDPLRQLRVVRFAAKRNATPDPELKTAIRSLADRLQIVARERKTEELRKVLEDGPETTEKALGLSRELGIQDEFFGGLNTDTATQVALRRLPKNADSATILATLAANTPNAEKTLTAMKLSTNEIRTATTAARLAKSFTTDEPDGIEANRAVRSYDTDTLLRGLTVAHAQGSTSTASKLGSTVKSVLSNPIKVRALRGPIPIGGDDLLARGLSGPAIGSALERVTEAFLRDPQMSREEALRVAGVSLTAAATPEQLANKGNFEALRRWYTEGGGADRIAWGTKGDFTRCMNLVSKYLPPEILGGFCQNRHMEIYGESNAARDARDEEAAVAEEFANDCHEPDSGRFCSTGRASTDFPADDAARRNPRASAWWVKASEEFDNGLTPKQRLSVEYYGGSDDNHWINGVARGKKTDPWGNPLTPEQTQRFKQDVENLDAAISNAAPFKNAIVTYRGIRLPKHFTQDEADDWIKENYQPGSMVGTALGGFQSTSFRIEAPLAVSGKSDSHQGIVFELKGRHGVALGNHPFDAEILYGRNQQFGVVQVLKDVPFVGYVEGNVRRTVIQLEEVE